MSEHANDAAGPTRADARLAAIAREDLSRFLAACLYEPTPLFAQERMFVSMQAAARHIDGDLAERVAALGRAFEADDLQTLLVDYTRLFLGPVDPVARPYGCSWLSGDGTLMQDSTMAVLALYREGGFDLDPALGELPDHIAIELEFLYVVAFRERQAQEAGDAAEAERLAGLTRRFLADHLGRWGGRLGEALEKGAGTAFYRCLGLVLQAWVARVACAGPRFRSP